VTTQKPQPAPVSAAALARLLEITPQAVSAWRKAGCPVQPGGRSFRVAEVVRWLTDRERQKLEEDLLSGESRDRWEAARALRTEHEAAIAGLELAKLQAELITVDDAVKGAERVFVRLRALVLALPSKSAYRVVGLKTLPAATRALREIADGLLGAFVASTDEDPPAAA